jgi:hypothetical protein
MTLRAFITDVMENTVEGKSLTSIVGPYTVDSTNRLVIQTSYGYRYIFKRVSKDQWNWRSLERFRSFKYQEVKGNGGTLTECLRECWKSFVIDRHVLGLAFHRKEDKTHKIIFSIADECIDNVLTEEEIYQKIIEVFTKGMKDPIEDPLEILAVPKWKSLLDVLGFELYDIKANRLESPSDLRYSRLKGWIISQESLFTKLFVNNSYDINQKNSIPLQINIEARPWKCLDFSDNDHHYFSVNIGGERSKVPELADLIWDGKVFKEKLLDNSFPDFFKMDKDVIAIRQIAVDLIEKVSQGEDCESALSDMIDVTDLNHETMNLIRKGHPRLWQDILKKIPDDAAGVSADLGDLGF